ncbi:hypothetical protein K2173_011884 [Erythroxylum novogranatense]|uniref:Transmembrane protein n=1 Tax=Erythroxylum novogranatense TaxID=1862640 RepID=A0AAV8T0Q1_9ROSI|nr:hypothetical protein K2173_011884 [Erythroxylum novogranatense]
MKSLSSVGLGLSIVFGCLLLALVAELYYLLWWKRRLTNREIGEDYSSPARELFYMFCLRKPSSSMHSGEVCSSVRITDTLVNPEQESHPHVSTSKDLLLKPFGTDDQMETELMRLQSLSGPPRFLFTIIEETKEDLESEDAKSRGDNKSGKGSRSLSDLLVTVETPYLTPLASPPFLTPPLTPMSCSSYNQQEFHSFEASIVTDHHKLRTSPPSTFKFLQAAEEKLFRRKLLEEVDKEVQEKDGYVQDYRKKDSSSQEEEDGPFITITVDKYKESELSI